MNNVDPKTGEVRDEEGTDFAVFLVNLAEGATNAELSENLRRLVVAVKETGKPGQLSYTLKVKPMDTDMQTVAMVDQITVKLPEFDRPKSLRFYDGEGNLTTEPKNQQALMDRYLNMNGDNK